MSAPTHPIKPKMVAQKLLGLLIRAGRRLNRTVLALSKTAWQTFPKRLILAVSVLLLLPAFGLLTAFGVAPDTASEQLTRRQITETLVLPPLQSNSVAAETFLALDRVQRGDSVATVLARLNVVDTAAFNYLRTAQDARMIYQLRPGRSMQATTDGTGKLKQLRYFYGSEKYLDVSRKPDGGFTAADKPLVPTVQIQQKAGVIRSSLFGATDALNIPDAIATQIARVFSTDIDFHIDLRKDDTFSVVYEMLYQDGEYLRPGRVLSAQFVNNGKTFEAFLFTDPEGNENYFSADGSNRAKSFLRSPLEFSRVSSTFGARFHPIFKNWRQHTGVDFAAPQGTRIWAVADGMVDYAGVKGGYGNVVEIRHSGAVTTLYAHMSAFAPNVRKGSRVRQGEVIGFVGKTGFATGPHLHYEFKIAGQHQDPMRVALPKADPLPAQYKAQFLAMAKQQSAQLVNLREVVAETKGIPTIRFE